MLYRAHSPKWLPTDSDIMDNPFYRFDRRPRHMPYQLHLIMGLWFHQKFGLNFRANAYFCTGNIRQAHEFEFPIIEIEPVGDYQLCFSPEVEDLCLSMQRYERNILPYFDKQSSIFKTLESFNFQHFKNAGLEEAAASGCEVMLFAKQYRFKSIE